MEEMIITTLVNSSNTMTISDGDNDSIVDFITDTILKSFIFHDVINPPRAETEELLK